MRGLDGITDSMDMSLCKLREMVACCCPWGRREWDTTERMKSKRCERGREEGFLLTANKHVERRLLPVSLGKYRLDHSAIPPVRESRH